MQELIAPAVDTRPFCYSLGMGRRDMCMQEDGNELLKKIVDQVDNAFKGAIGKAQGEEEKQALTEAQKRLYNDVFIGNIEQVVMCSECQHQSSTTQQFSDILLPICPDYFQCLATLLVPEEITEYKCETCHKSVKAFKFLKIKNVPAVAAMSLQRFYYDIYADQYQKNPAAVKFPMALDLQFVSRVSYERFNQVYSGDELVGMLMEYLYVLCQPWLYFGQEKLYKIQNSYVEKLIMEDSEYMEYVQKYYAGKPIHNAFAVQPDGAPNFSYVLPCIQKQAIPEGLFVLQSIVCHIGVIDAGHYFTLYNDIR